MLNAWLNKNDVLGLLSECETINNFIDKRQLPHYTNRNTSTKIDGEHGTNRQRKLEIEKEIIKIIHTNQDKDYFHS